MGQNSPPMLEEVLHAARKIAPFPNVVWKVMPLVQKMAPVDEIETVIKYDQAITAKVLTLSQSPFYARRHSVGTLRDAIVSLGQRQLVQVVMAACSARYFSGDTAGYDLTEGELWEHSVATALMSEMLAKELGNDKVLTIYTAALLHDIGKTIMNLFVSDYLGKIMEVVKERKISFLEAEQQMIGIDHEKLGGLIAERWKFPKDVIAAIRNHHHPMDAGEDWAVTAIVYAANRMVSAMGIGTGVDGMMQPNKDDAFQKVGLDTKTIDKLIANLAASWEETKQFLAA